MCDIAMINEPTFLDSPYIFSALLRFYNTLLVAVASFVANGFPCARSALSDHTILVSNLNL